MITFKGIYTEPCIVNNRDANLIMKNMLSYLTGTTNDRLKVINKHFSGIEFYVINGDIVGKEL